MLGTQNSNVKSPISDLRSVCIGAPSVAKFSAANLSDLAEIFCPECGYDLRSIDSARCPECGTQWDRTQLARSRLPWAARATIGRGRAYARTVWLAIVRPRRVADEVARPVSM